MKTVKKWASRAIWWVAYITEITRLAVCGDISWLSWRYAATNYPAAVCGPTCAWIVDPDLQM